MPNNFVPDIPPDWAAKEAQGTPYVLSVTSGSPSWRAVVVLEAVTVGTDAVTANGRPVFVA